MSYNSEYDYYELIIDTGQGFPYEFYDEIELDHKNYYILYLDYIERYPTISTDKWIDIHAVESFLRNRNSKHEEGDKKHQALIKVIRLYIDTL